MTRAVNRKKSRPWKSGKHDPTRLSAGQGIGLAVAIVALLALGISLSAGADAPPEGYVPDVWTDGRIRVEVLNAGGVSGMAKNATDLLRPVGFDVVDFGNFRPFDESRVSAVIDRVGRSEPAAAVAARLGIDNVQSDPDPNLYVDVTVVLGQEWVEPLGGTADVADSVHIWWDPRGWFGR